uniref:CGGC domain-containing protein n=1 Tax=Heterorhabditis bacteriophora TaxID=37862 RepID=A0A1I7XKF5_HETBA
MTSVRVRRLQSLLTSPSKIITHIHCYGPNECGAFDTICSLLDDHIASNKNTVPNISFCVVTCGERSWERIEGTESVTNNSPISVAFENPSEGYFRIIYLSINIVH